MDHDTTSPELDNWTPGELERESLLGELADVLDKFAVMSDDEIFNQLNSLITYIEERGEVI